MNMDGKKVEVISSGKRGVVEGIRTDDGVLKYAVRYESGNIYNVLAKNIRVVEEQIELPECEYLQTCENVPVLLLPAPCEHLELKHVATTTEGIYARCAVCGKLITVYLFGDAYSGNPILDRLAVRETAFRNFFDFMNTAPSYHPSLYADSDERILLANAFDMVCIGLRQNRRAYRGALALYESGIPEVIIPAAESSAPEAERPRWTCAHCGQVYEDKEDARLCCVDTDTCYKSCYCGVVHDDEDDAEDCCDAGCISGYLCHCGEFYECMCAVESCECHNPEGYDLCPICGQPDMTGYCCAGAGRWTPDLPGQMHLVDSFVK